MRQCAICNITDKYEDEEDILIFGDWMTKQNVTVHYYCLLLSTNLPQRGGDSSGILGFLLRDIRQEATAAQQRICKYCNQKGASVFCCKCRIVFHVGCAAENQCISHFTDEFPSYCEDCAPHDDYQRQLLANPPAIKQCDICFHDIEFFTISQVTYGDCCRQGFAHRICMRRYAIASGYYLRCLWCRDKKFHDTIKLQSVFVPDRDASWERQANAYSELHNRRMRCDQGVCLCPSGRDFNRNTWTIKLCKLCAATGSHLKCLVGTMKLPKTKLEFKCQFCTEVELKLQQQQQNSPNKSNWKGVDDEHIDASFYIHKKSSDSSLQQDDDDSPAQSDEDSASTSNITVVPSSGSSVPANAADSVIELPDTQPLDILETLTPPLLLCKSGTFEGHFYLVVYEYKEQEPEPLIGQCTLRFALDDERIQDKSEEALLQLKATVEDVYCRDSNRGIYDEVDQLAAHL
ncbi:PHD finger protein 7-like [Drosophila innubila]|uniref:PHD finger protein 7-like n=1 Tax=Drosophila innubila TaxID=198719 RepID=UPI00148C6413|nr:PHD finger protein 7-like [Drosophila innubila]